MLHLRPSSYLLVFALCAGCFTDAAIVGHSGGETEGTSTDGSALDGSSGRDASSDSEATSATSTSSSTGTTGTTEPGGTDADDDGDPTTGSEQGAGIEGCSTTEQDCPDGFKCDFIADGDTTMCTPVSDFPQAVGQPCARKGDSDSCARGSWCAPSGFAGPDVCQAYCEPGDADPSCGTGTSCAALSEESAVCVPTCEPFFSQCPSGQRCHALEALSYDEFACVAIAGTESPAGGPCDDSLQCADGTICTQHEGFAEKICTPLCDSVNNVGCFPSWFCVPVDDLGGAGICIYLG